MTPLRLVAACLLTLLLVPASRAKDTDPFLELARAYRPEEAGRLPALRARLAVERPDLFARPLPMCPLRSALAKALSADEARAWLARPCEDPDALAVVVGNLAARPDLAALVLETGAYERLAPGHGRLLCDVAANALLDGDDRMVRRLLAGPQQERTAEALSSLAHPEGLRFLADVVAGAVPLPAEARARLARYEPDVQNERPTRPLGAARVEALGRVAATDADPALRALAARVLLRANDPTYARETVRAFVATRSVHLWSVDWHHLAKLAPEPVGDLRVSMAHRLDMLESWLLWTWIRAELEPLEAEGQAAVLRRALAAAADSRFRGEAIRLLADHVGVFVTTTRGRQRAVPSLLGILDDLEAGRPSDPPSLAALAREVAGRIRAEVAEERGYPHVRVREVPFASEAAWRAAEGAPTPSLAGIDSMERFEGALARLEDAAVPPDDRVRLFEHLLFVALDGGPGRTESEGEDDEETPFDRRAFDRLVAWLAERAPDLDGGLSEALVEELLDRDVPEALEAGRLEAVERAVDRVPPGGERIRLEALREAWRGSR